jgi:hypothetical protein
MTLLSSEFRPASRGGASWSSGMPERRWESEMNLPNAGIVDKSIQNKYRHNILLLLACGVISLSSDIKYTYAGDTYIPVIYVTLPSSANDSGPVGAVGFDDVVYDPATRSILLPGGRSGNLYSIDTTTTTPTASIVAEGFTKTDAYESGSHDFGVTSVVALPDGLLVATDRAAPNATGYPGSKVGDANAPTLTVVNPNAPFNERVVSKVALMTKPDFIRYIALTGKIWVSEPDGGNKMQIFSRPTRANSAPTLEGTVSFDDGPESLSVDEVRGVAYSNAGTETVSVKLSDGSIGSVKWDSGCAKPKFIAVDQERGIAFNACLDGGVVAHDVATGAVVGQLSPEQTGGGVDILGYSPRLSHLYVASGRAQKLTIVGVLDSSGAKDRLQILGQTSTGGTDNYTSNAVADDLGHVWVPRPLTGDVGRFTDPFPASGNF